MQSYMFLLYIEYARLVSPDRDNGKMVRPPFHSLPFSPFSDIRTHVQDFILPGVKPATNSAIKTDPEPAAPPPAAEATETKVPAIPTVESEEEIIPVTTTPAAPSPVETMTREEVEEKILDFEEIGERRRR